MIAHLFTEAEEGESTRCLWDSRKPILASLCEVRGWATSRESKGKKQRNDPDECAQGQGLKFLARRGPGTQSKTIKRLSTSRR